MIGFIEKYSGESKIKFDVHAVNDKLNEKLKYTIFSKKNVQIFKRFVYSSCLPETVVSNTTVASFIKYYLEEIGSNILKPLLENESEIDISKNYRNL